MSLITRCPACTTLFKVVPDQLRVSEGWVRCGQCDEVFDANAHLQGDAIASAATAATSEADASAALPSGSESHLPVEAVSGEDGEPHISSDPEPQLEQELAAQLEWPEKPLAAEYDALMDVRPGAAFEPGPVLHLDLPGAPDMQLAADDLQAPDQDTVVSTHSDEASSMQGDAGQPDSDVILVEPSAIPDTESMPEPAFMRTARKAERRWVRWILMVAAFVLMVGLLGHGVWRERDRLAANVPDLRPALTAMCSTLGCQIQPFKQIDTVVIDNSSFVKIRGDVYRLNVTLKNVAPIDVAAPALELTLTDLQDQPMIRHVLSATELGALQGTLPAGGELSAALPIQVKVAGATDRISGYRLLAFYP